MLGIFFVFQNYIVRGFAGRWRSVGDSFGSGRQYDPKPYGQGGTLECFLYRNPSNGLDTYWVATRCFETCLRNRNGFGSTAIMGQCRGNCYDDHPSGAYEDCKDPDTPFVP
jgi:hypothetical protein